MDQFINIKINSVGCSKCRPSIFRKLKEYFLIQSRFNQLCPDCRQRVKKNPFRVIDCKEKKCQKLSKRAPIILDRLCNECANHFKQVLECLDESKVVYDLSNTLVRGLDYYTKTVFEVVKKGDYTKKEVLVGGGRYDELIETYSNIATPATGFSFGLDRIINLMREKKISVPQKDKKTEVYIAQLGEPAKIEAEKIIQALKKAGIKVKSALARNTLQSQLKAADKLKARFTIIIGQKEILNKTMILKNMTDGLQITVPKTKILETLQEKLGHCPKKLS